MKSKVHFFLLLIYATFAAFTYCAQPLLIINGDNSPTHSQHVVASAADDGDEDYFPPPSEDVDQANEAYNTETHNFRRAACCCGIICSLSAGLTGLSIWLRTKATTKPLIDWAQCVPPNSSMPAKTFGVSIKNCGICLGQIDSTMNAAPYCEAQNRNFTQFMLDIEDTVGADCDAQAQYCVAPYDLAHGQVCQNSSNLAALKQQTKACVKPSSPAKKPKRTKNSLSMNEIRKQLALKSNSKKR